MNNIQQYSRLWLIGILIFIVLMLIWGDCRGQEPDITIRDFSGGWVTNANIFGLKPNQSLRLFNIDLSKVPTGIRKRNGIVAMTDTLEGDNEIIGIYGFYSSLGDKSLFIIKPDADDSAWGGLVRSDEQTYGPNANVTYDYIYNKNAPFWETWRNRVIGANGVQLPWIWHDTIGNVAENAVPLMGEAPGEFLLAPTNESGALDGSYFYTILQKDPPCSVDQDWSTQEGLILGPVYAENQNVVIWGFDRSGKASGCFDAADTTTIIGIFRTRAVKEYNKRTTYFFLIDTLYDSADVSSRFFIDTVRDESLGSGSHSDSLREFGGVLIDGRYGAPFLKARNESASSADTVFKLLTFYKTIIYDTLLGVRSGHSQTWQVTDGGWPSSPDTSYVIYVPPIPANITNSVRLIYKANIATTAETQYFYLLDTMFFNVIDTFYDNIPYDSLGSGSYAELIANDKNRIYFDGVRLVGDRLWGWKGSRIYFSGLDTSSQWDAFNFISFNDDDGEHITTVVPHRGDIIVYKASNSFILYEDASGNFTKKWMIPNVGCIAPHSMVSIGDSRIYLGKDGVYQENGLPNKDRGSSLRKLSLPIDDIFREYTIAEKKNARAIIFEDRQYWLSFPDKDSTFVYDFDLGLWMGPYSFAFEQATNYDTITAARFNRARDVLFVMDGSDQIFYFTDTSGKDTGVNIPVSWKSIPINISSRITGISNIAIYCEPNDIDSAFSFELFDDNDTSYVLQFSVTPSNVYHKFAVAPKEVGHWFYIIFTQPGGASTLSVPDFNGIDIWLKDGGMPDTK